GAGGGGGEGEGGGAVGGAVGIDAIEGVVGGADPPEVMTVGGGAGGLDADDGADVALRGGDGTDDDFRVLIVGYGDGGAGTGVVGGLQGAEGHAAAFLEAAAVGGEGDEGGPGAALGEGVFWGIVEGGGGEDVARRRVGRGLRADGGGEGRR